MLLGMYFVVALVLGNLTTRIRSQQEAERERETRATALYLLTRDLNESIDLDQMVERIVQQIQSALNHPRLCGSSTLITTSPSIMEAPSGFRIPSRTCLGG